MLKSEGKAKTFIRALATGRFPEQELEKFAQGSPSLVDEFVEDPTLRLEAMVVTTDPTAENEAVSPQNLIRDDMIEVVDESKVQGEADLPVVQTKDVLGSLASTVVTSADEEAVEFLVASALAKLWRRLPGRGRSHRPSRGILGRWILRTGSIRVS